MGKDCYYGFLFLGVMALLGSVEADLVFGFYAKSCPKAEKIVSDYVHKHIPNAPSLAATILRMNFHDCFVRVSFYLLLLFLIFYLSILIIDIELSWFLFK